MTPREQSTSADRCHVQFGWVMETAAFMPHRSDGGDLWIEITIQHLFWVSEQPEKVFEEVIQESDSPCIEACGPWWLTSQAQPVFSGLLGSDWTKLQLIFLLDRAEHLPSWIVFVSPVTQPLNKMQCVIRICPLDTQKIVKDVQAGCFRCSRFYTVWIQFFLPWVAGAV